MSAFNDMQPVEQLYAFMDGELDPFFENQLFSELAINEDLRAEMKDLLTMREAVRHDTVLPSPIIRERLLASAGLAGAGATVAIGFWSAARSAFSTWVTPILGIALGTGAAALLLLSHRPAEQSASHIIAPPNDVPVLTLITPAEHHNSPETMLAAAAAKSGRLHRNTLYSRHTTSAYLSANRLNQGSASVQQILSDEVRDAALNGNSASSEAQNKNTNAAYSSASSANLNTIDMQTNAQPIVHTAAKPARLPQIAGADNDSHQGISIRFRGLFNQSFPASNISAESSSWINNTAFGATFHFTPELAAGVEIGMERFAQVFGSAEGASEIWYEQNPQMLWAGVLAQYKLMQIGSEMDAHVYGESFVGAAGTLGFLGRQSIGINITPIPSLTVSAGAETAILPYIYKSHWFSTEKFGFTVGLSFTPEGLR